MQRKSISRISMIATPVMIVCGYWRQRACQSSVARRRTLLESNLRGDYGFASKA